MKPAQTDTKLRAATVSAIPPGTPAAAPPPAVKWLDSTQVARIELTRPVISLQGSYYDNATGGHVRVLTPEHAYIDRGILVIEELGIWFPLSSIHHGKRNAP